MYKNWLGATIGSKSGLQKVMIFTPISKNEQLDVINHGIAETLIKGETGIKAADKGIDELYQTG